MAPCSTRSNAISTARIVNTPDQTLLGDPERQLALSYAPPHSRGALATLWRLDERLGGLVAAAREPMIGAMRLIWWRDALVALDHGDDVPPAEPLLTAIATQILPAGLSGHALSGLEEGWSALIEQENPGPEQILAHGEGRGGPLFALSAALLGSVPDDVGRAGEGWALADLGHRLSDAAARQTARALAAERLAQVDIARWPAALRPLGLLVTLARIDATMPGDQLRRQGAPKRLFRALAYRLLGR